MAKSDVATSLTRVNRVRLGGADTRGRTGDLILTKNALYQLSYVGKLPGQVELACLSSPNSKLERKS